MELLRLVGWLHHPFAAAVAYCDNNAESEDDISVDSMNPAELEEYMGDLGEKLNIPKEDTAAHMEAVESEDECSSGSNRNSSSDSGVSINEATDDDSSVARYQNIMDDPLFWDVLCEILKNL